MDHSSSRLYVKSRWLGLVLSEMDIPVKVKKVGVRFFQDGLGNGVWRPVFHRHTNTTTCVVPSPTKEASTTIVDGKLWIKGVCSYWVIGSPFRIPFLVFVFVFLHQDVWSIYIINTKETTETVVGRYLWRDGEEVTRTKLEGGVSSETLHTLQRD